MQINSGRNSRTQRLAHLISSVTLAYSLVQGPTAWAIDPINSSFLSPRSVGMGGVVMSTGLYEENFFNNPARVTMNPESKLTLFQFTAETNTNTLGLISNTSGTLGNILNRQAGKNLHERVQLVLPAWYLAALDSRKLAIGFGFIGGAQSNLDLSNNYQTSGSTLLDVGPALTLGYKLLSDDSLSIGTTLHGTYRFSINQAVNLMGAIAGTSSVTSNSLINNGAMYNLDLGVFYRFLQLGPWEFHAALAGQNLLGGAFTSIRTPINQIGSTPIPQNTSVGVGVSIGRENWDFLGNTTLALEATNIFNNSSGSVFRLIHIGLETHLKSIAFRAGLNQGYLTAGLGVDFFYFALNFATYGEELALNVGRQEDRRYAMNLGIHF